MHISDLKTRDNMDHEEEPSYVDDFRDRLDKLIQSAQRFEEAVGNGEADAPGIETEQKEKVGARNILVALLRKKR